MAAILNSAIMVSSILHKKTSLILSDSTGWLQLCWNLPSSIQPFYTKKTSLIHSDSTWWWQPSWILPSLIETLPSWIQRPCYLLSDSLKNTLTQFWLWLKLIQSDSNSFIVTQLDDISHLEFCHVGFSHFAQNSDSNLFNLTQTHSFWLNLMISDILNSAILDSDIAILDSNTLLSSLRFTQKHSSSTLTLTQANLIWLT